MSDQRRDRVDAVLDHVRDQLGEGAATKEVHIRLRRLTHWLEIETRRRLAPHGMEFWELPMLSVLIRSGGSLSVGALQDHAQVTSGAITNRIAKLETAGFVRRTFDPRDRRQVNVEVTEDGQRRFEALLASVNEVEDELFANASPELLTALAANLRELMLSTEGEFAEIR